MEIFRSISKSEYITIIDLNTAHYAIRLIPRSSMLTAFILPFGKYSWRSLAMGISTTPDYFQARTDQLLGEIEFCRLYSDDGMALTEKGTFRTHLEHMNVVFDQLRCWTHCQREEVETRRGRGQLLRGPPPKSNRKDHRNPAFQCASQHEGIATLYRSHQLLP